MDPAKVTAIRDWPEPHKKKELQAFLGFTNFYRRFIKDYSAIARPLTRLTGKEEWKWESEQVLAFLALKEHICAEPVLALPINDAPYRIECDASDYAIGSVLSQLQKGKWHPVAFLSKSLNSTERNYEIYDREMMAIMVSLSEWRQYLLDADQVFEIWTDHLNLSYFRHPQKLNRRQARWTTELQEYNFTLIHKPGKTNIKADLLSRRTDFERGENDNENVVLLKPEWFLCSQEFIFEASDSTFIQRIRGKKDKVDFVVRKAILKKDPEYIQHEDGTITMKNRVYVPKDAKLREDIIREHHDSCSAGHPGRYKTQELITRDYWWPYIATDIRKYVDGCEACQRTKPRRGKPHNPLNPNEIPDAPWEHISIDLIGKLVESNGYDAILVIVDRLSKMIIVIPTNMELTAFGVARIYRNHVWSKHSLPRKVISDRGPQFAAKFMKDLHELTGVKANLSTAYHPQTDGQTERINQEVEQYLRLFVDH